MNTALYHKAVQFSEDFVKNFFAWKDPAVAGAKMQSIISASIFVLFVYYNTNLHDKSSFEEKLQNIDYLSELILFLSDENYRNSIRKLLLPSEGMIYRQSHEAQFLFSNYLETLQTEKDAELTEDRVVRKAIADAYAYLDSLSESDLQQMTAYILLRKFEK